MSMQSPAEPREEPRNVRRSGAVDLPSIDEVLADPAASFWLKTTLRSAMCRDPINDAHDSEILARLLEERCNEVLSGS